MNPPLCFSTLGCPEVSVESLCRLATRHAVRRVEIRSLAGIVDYPGHLAAGPGLLDKVAEVFYSQGVAVALLASSFSLTRSTEAEIDGLLAVCRVADRLGAPYVRIFGGGGEGHKMTGAELAAAAALFRRVHDRHWAGGARCQLLVETHGSLVDSGTIGRFCELADREVLFLWDAHHTWKLGGEALERTFALIGPRVRHIHCKDSLPQLHGPAAYRYVLPGSGDFPFDALLRLAGSLDERVALSLEWERQWHPELEPLEEALERFSFVVSRNNAEAGAPVAGRS